MTIKKETKFTFFGYYISGLRPIAVIPTADGGADILAYDWATHTLVRNLDAFANIYDPDHSHDTVEVTKEGLDLYIKKIQVNENLDKAFTEIKSHHLVKN